VGLGLAVPPLTASSLDAAALDRSGALTIGARHLGLVVALVVLTPVLANDLDAAQSKAIDRGADVVLDSSVSIGSKVPLMIDLTKTLRGTPDAEVPDFGPTFARHESSGNRGSLERLRHDLVTTIHAVLTRSTRRAFGLSALLAAAGLLPLPVYRRRRRSAS
jgi:hypothetical protein